MIKKLLLFSSILLFLNGFTSNQDWYLFESKALGFTVEFPRKPKLTKKEVTTDSGKLEMYFIAYDALSADSEDQNLAYMISCVAYPLEKSISFTGENLSTLYKKGIEGAIKSKRGELIEEKTIFVQDYEAREIKLYIPESNFSMIMRFILVKNRLYMIQVGSKQQKSANKSMGRFINSFKLL